MVTITSIDVDSEMNRAIVYFDSLLGEDGDADILAALASHRVRLQSSVGREVRAKKTPILTFKPDETIRAAERIERILARQGHDARADRQNRSMARRKPPTTHGLAVVDKPAGVTSHDVVGMLRKRFGERQVGHAGTLDPDATGVLLVGVGKATRLLRFLTALGKTYTARCRARHVDLDARRQWRGHRHVRHVGGHASTWPGLLPPNISPGRSCRSRRWCPRCTSTAGDCTSSPGRASRSNASPRPVTVYSFDVEATDDPIGVADRGAMLGRHLHPLARRRPRTVARRWRAPHRPSTHCRRQLRRERGQTTRRVRTDRAGRGITRLPSVSPSTTSRPTWSAMVGCSTDSTATDRGPSSTSKDHCSPCTKRSVPRPSPQWSWHERLRRRSAAGIASTVVQLVTNLDSPPWPGERTVLTHRRVRRRAPRPSSRSSQAVRQLAAASGARSAVMTFDRHPASVVRPESAPKLLTDLDQKLELLAATGLDATIVIHFDEEQSREDPGPLRSASADRSPRDLDRRRR